MKLLIFFIFFYIFTIINLLVMSLFYYIIIQLYTYILTSLRINIYNIYFQNSLFGRYKRRRTKKQKNVLKVYFKKQ